MNNAARHALGLVAGVVAAPVVLLMWTYGVVETSKVLRYAMEASVVGIALLAGGGVILGLLCGSRVSPLASLVPGVVFAGLGVASLIEPYVLSRQVLDLLPGDTRMGFLTLTSTGMLTAVGVALLAASVPPSRWVVLQRPPAVPYPQLPFTVGGPGQPGVPGQPDFSGAGQPGTDRPVAGGPPPAGGPSPAVPPPGAAPQPPPLPYQPGA